MNKIKLAVLVGTILAPIALILLLRQSNTKKEERWKQWSHPLIALAYSVLCVLLFTKLTGLLDWLLNQSFMAQVKQWIQNGSGLTYGVYLYGAYLLNIAILIGYLVFKNTYRAFFGLTRAVIRFFVRLVSKKKREEYKKAKKLKIPKELPENLDEVKGPAKLYWELLNLFYRIDDGSGMIRAGWLAVCKTFLYACRILGVLYLLLILFAQLPLLAGFSWYPYAFAQRLMESCYLWPAISVVAILEFSYFLEGNETFPHEEKEEEAAEQPEEESPETDYSRLLESFRAEYPERFASSLKSTSYPRIREVPEPQTELAKALNERLSEWGKKKGRPVGKSTLDCITSLPDRRNAIIDAQLSDDFGECLMLYINVLLARGDNLLVLCRNEEVCEQIRNYINSSLEQINGLTPVWIVRSADEAYQAGDCDVLILPPEKALDETVISAQSRFFRSLTTVLMIDASRMISSLGLLLTAVANRLEVFAEKSIQYIALCNGMPDELRATLEQSFSPGNDFQAFECFSSDQSTRIMLWNYEPTGENLVYAAQHNLFKSALDHVYLGVALPLACTAFKNQIDDISVMGNNLPVQQLIDTIRLNYSHMSYYFSDSQTVEKLLDALRFNTIDSSNPFIIAIDDTYNLPSAIHNYSRYIGSNSAMVHLISKPYMLRDYFADKASEFMRDKSKMKMLSSVIRDSPKATVMRLFFEANSEAGLPESLMMSQLKKAGFEAGSLRAALQYCCDTIRGKNQVHNLEEYFAIRTTGVFDRKKNEFISQRTIKLKDDKLLKNLIQDIRPAYVDLEGRTVSLGIPHGNIFRYYLPDQTIIVAGKMYYIDRIDTRRGVLYTGRMVEDMDLPVDYTQHRQYILSEFPDQPERKMSRELGLGQADEKQASACELELLRNVRIQVNTLGYMVPNPSYPFPDLTNKAQYRKLEAPTLRNVQRTLPNGSVLSLRFKGVDEDKCDQLALTLSVMMSEVMKTLFPYNWQCIAVCPVLRKTPDSAESDIPFENLALIYPQVQFASSRNTETGTAEILIIDDSDIDSGMLDALFSIPSIPAITS